MVKKGFHLKTYSVFIAQQIRNGSSYVSTKTRHCRTPCQSVTQGVQIFLRRFPILMYSCDMNSFIRCCEQQLLRPFMTLQQDDSKVSLIIWNVFVHY